MAEQIHTRLGEGMQVQLSGEHAERAHGLLERALNRRDTELGLALEAAGWEVLWSPMGDRVMHASPSKRD